MSRSSIVKTHAVSGGTSLVVGMICLIIAWVMGGRNAAVEDYVRTTGTVVSSSVKVHQGNTEKGQTQTYSPAITYRYTVDGQDYDGTRYRTIVSRAAISPTQAIVDRYPVGSTCEVWHDTNAPASSVLDRSIGDEVNLIISILCGVGYSLVGIAALNALILWVRLRNSKSTD